MTRAKEFRVREHTRSSPVNPHQEQFEKTTADLMEAFQEIVIKRKLVRALAAALNVQRDSKAGRI